MAMFTDCSIEACKFSKIASTSTLMFEGGIIAAAAILLGLLAVHKQYALLKRFGLIAGGVLIFELFTQPLWNNHNMSDWAYLYIDISWILTLGWTLILFLSLLLVERGFGIKKQLPQFLLTILLSTVGGCIGEQSVLSLGIRTYSPEVQEALSGLVLPFSQAPMETLFYMPVFMTLVLSFAKYFEIVFKKIPLVPERKIVNWKSFVIAFVGVLLFEIMNEPAIQNIGWPAWSYIFLDVNILRIVIWVLILAIGGHLVHRFFIHHSPTQQFIISIVVLTILTIPIEGYLVAKGLRQYGPSLQAGFSGFRIPGTQLPAEILFAIPLYLTLIIAFVRYWTSVWENDL